MVPHPLENLSKIYVLMIPIRENKSIPYMGIDGRLELFTDPHLGQAAAHTLADRTHLQIIVQELEDREAIHQFFRSCMHDGMIVFRLNNGSEARQEYRFGDLFSFREPTLIEEKNRSLRHFLFRSHLYEYCCSLQPEEAQEEKLKLTEMALTMRYNAYREMYRGLLYALVDPADSSMDLDLYTVSALDRAKAMLEEKEIIEAGYTAVSLVHFPNQGGALYSSPLCLFFVNSPGQVGSIADGLVCAFTSYEAAEHGKALFASYQQPCSIVALTGSELLTQALLCAGVLVDLEETGFQISKKDLGLWETYGQLNAPILVRLKNQKESTQEQGGDIQ